MQRKVIAVSLSQAVVFAVGEFLGISIKPTEGTTKTTLNTAPGASGHFAFKPPVGISAPVVMVQSGATSANKQGLPLSTQASLTTLLLSLAKLVAKMQWQTLLRLIIATRETLVKSATDDREAVVEVDSFFIKLSNGMKVKISILLNSSGEALGRIMRFISVLENPDLDEASPA